MYKIEFEWHETKAKTNAQKHGICFEEAMTCFYDSRQVAFYDPDHTDDSARQATKQVHTKPKLTKH